MESTAVKAKLMHPTTKKPLDRVYITDKGWYGWNDVYNVYNNTKDYSQLQTSEVVNVDYAMVDAVEESEKVFRWDNPHEWLRWAVLNNQSINANDLLNMIIDKCSADDIQNYFQTDMDEDGYFKPEGEEEDQDDEWDEEEMEDWYEDEDYDSEMFEEDEEDI